MGSPPAVAHLAFAIGILPLILAATSHFVPVLTRTGDPVPAISRLPFAAQVAGLAAVLAMQETVPRWLLPLAAAVDIVLAGLLLNWVAGRVRAALDSPHPGWRWYGAALVCLIMALLAVLLMEIWPAYRNALRIFHLHLNVLGLVGLAALGTVPVLLPTALQMRDPESGSWLRRQLWLIAGGALVVATGAAVVWEFAVLGAALMMVAVLGLLGQWIRRFGIGQLLGDGVSASLLAALLGLCLTLMAGVAHGTGLSAARPDLLGWSVAFLLPLVSAALSQLLPVWRWPGPETPARLQMRHKLAANGRWRSGLWLASGGAFLAGLDAAASFMLASGLLLFAASLLQAVRVSHPLAQERGEGT
ncbi:MAG: hypothetical protein JNK92_13155 [Dechloromonas sp.]|nr:hypothetical protein [Dechloromonas sp.]